MMKSLIYILLLLLLVGAGTQEAWARKKKKHATAETVKTEQTPYQKLFQGKKVSTSKGLMTVHTMDGKA